MTYSTADFFGLLLLAWIVIFFLHQAIGGLLALFNRGVKRRHAIEIVNLRNKP